MLSLIICEDNDIQRERIKDFCELIIARDRLDIEIELCTGKPEEVVKYMDNKEKFVGVYLLDVDLSSKMNGIKLAEYIRKKDLKGYIIFITTHSELSYLTFRYKVEAMDYIIKDNHTDIKQRLSECLSLICNVHYSPINLDDDIISIEHEDKVINMPLNEILFIETSDKAHKIIIHSENRQLEVYGTLKDLQEKLNDNFYRCHKAYCVNVKKIKEIDKLNRLVYMINGESCYVSFRYLSGLLKNI